MFGSSSSASVERPDTKKSFIFSGSLPVLFRSFRVFPRSVPAFPRSLRPSPGLSVGVYLLRPGCSPRQGKMIFLCLDGDFFVHFALTSFLFYFFLLGVLHVFTHRSTLTRCLVVFLCPSGCFRRFLCFSQVWRPCAYVLKYHHEVRKKADPNGSGPIILLLALRFFLPTSWCPGKAGRGEKIVIHFGLSATVNLSCSHDLCVVLLESSRKCVDDFN